MDHVALRTEIENDPASMGYAALVTAGSDAAIAALMNSLTSPGAATITLDRVAKDKVLPLSLLITKNAAVLADANKKARWMQVAMALVSADTIPTTQATIVTTFTEAIADGVITTGQANSLRQRTGSRAEVLFGSETTVSAQDVFQALRGQA